MTTEFSDFSVWDMFQGVFYCLHVITPRIQVYIPIVLKKPHSSVVLRWRSLKNFKFEEILSSNLMTEFISEEKHGMFCFSVLWQGEGGHFTTKNAQRSGNIISFPLKIWEI